MKAQSLLALILSNLIAQITFANEKSDFNDRYYASNFNGMKGIVFVCKYDLSDPVLEKICNRASTDLELLAAVHNVSLIITKPNDSGDMVYQAAIRHFIPLEYELTATKVATKYDIKAINARLTYDLFYSNAVEANAEPGSFDSFPRSGDLEIWSASTIGSGQSTEIVQSFSDAMESNLKQGLTLFIKYRK